jgi:hypothetical protein
VLLEPDGQKNSPRVQFAKNVEDDVRVVDRGGRDMGIITNRGVGGKKEDYDCLHFAEHVTGEFPRTAEVPTLGLCSFLRLFPTLLSFLLFSFLPSFLPLVSSSFSLRVVLSVTLAMYVLRAVFTRSAAHFRQPLSCLTFAEKQYRSWPKSELTENVFTELGK